MSAMTHKNRFLKKHLLITGEARGIGFEIARQFGLAGARVTLFDTHLENLESSVETLIGEDLDISGILIDVSC